MSELDDAAAELKRRYPRCKDVIDREVQSLRDEAKGGPVAVQELAMELGNRIERQPCARNRKKPRKSTKGRRSTRRKNGRT